MGFFFLLLSVARKSCNPLDCEKSTLRNEPLCRTSDFWIILDFKILRVRSFVLYIYEWGRRCDDGHLSRRKKKLTIENERKNKIHNFHAEESRSNANATCVKKTCRTPIIEEGKVKFSILVCIRIYYIMRRYKFRLESRDGRFQGTDRMENYLMDSRTI